MAIGSDYYVDCPKVAVQPCRLCHGRSLWVNIGFHGVKFLRTEQNLQKLLKLSLQKFSISNLGMRLKIICIKLSFCLTVNFKLK